ncbi:hypothetical protein BCR35DRAFT_311527 [Leucosporidium creatinivorum]|uniref:Uncharacterized protein n=1 Tax=Leucosporidium creatinivorum TaxID=106004 RepID=A0A1Y2BVH9_9BASI|nr:hypothetical protein BCR35DRAFT_311527 [Leucosporidium creatinivorum]
MTATATSTAIRRPLAQLPTAFAACSAQSIAYGKCIGASYTDVERGMCEQEFRAFKACVKEAIKRK